MRVSSGLALPDLASSGSHGNRSTPDDQGEADFDHHLQNAGKGSVKGLHGQKSSHSQKPQPVDALTHPSRWPGFAAKLDDGDSDTNVTPAEFDTDDIGKLAGDDPKTDGGKTKREDKHQPQTAPVQDQVPLLIARHDVRRVPTSDQADGDQPAAASTTPQPDLAGNMPTKSPIAEASTKLSALDRSISMGAPLLTPKDSATKSQKDNTGHLESALSSAPSIGDAENSQDAPPQVAATVRSKLEDGAQTPAAKHSHADRQAPAAHVTVTGEQNFPAPAPHPPSQTATSLASAIAMDSSVRQAMSASAGLVPSATPVTLPSHILKIELHPAELGMVTASLRLASGQLSIELRPENHEAHRRLSSDTDALVKSLQGMGFDIDKVTVLQPSVAINAPPRTDAASVATNPGGRDQSSFQSGSSGSNGGASGGQQSGRNRDNDGQNSGRNAPHPHERAGGDLFI